AVVIKNLPRSRVRLIESGNNSFSRFQGFIAGKTASNGSEEIGLRERVLEAARDSKTLKLAHVGNELDSFGTRAGEIDRHEYPRDRNLVIFKTVSTGMQVGVEFEADARRNLL